MSNMEQYLGVKLLHAELGREPHGNHEAYKVMYPDGYTSWSPKDVFEEAYRRIDNLTFGLAIEAMKKGMKVARTGWNGKGMFIWLSPCKYLGFNELYDPEFQNIAIKNPDGCMIIGGHINMKDANGNAVIGWLASQTDMLAEDWTIIE